MSFDVGSIRQIGKYPVTRYIAEGGMAWVFKVKDTDLFDAPRALKLLKPEASDGDDYQRFLAEAQILATIQHPNLVHIFPMAFAWWVGLLVTALNLIPCGQLDGGHILYSLFSKKLHAYISKIMVVMLIILGVGTNEILVLGDKYFSLLQIFPILANISFEGWLGWLIWAFLLTVLGTNHPPTVLDDLKVIDNKRKILALVAVMLFIGSFTPVPLTIEQVLP